MEKIICWFVKSYILALQGLECAAARRKARGTAEGTEVV